MVEQLGAEVVPGGAIKLFLVRFFVVTTQHSKQGEATEGHLEKSTIWKRKALSKKPEASHRP
jgi:hypothetical protein